MGSIAAGTCTDAHFEAEVTRDAGAYDNIRRYHITATDSVSLATGTSPMPRELYVEYLISQSRNSINDIKLNGTSIPAGGSMTMMVGNTYTIDLVGSTATQGYNQFEAFINFPNTIFQILGVSTIYSANDSPYVSDPNDKLYADACLWENDPNSPNYRSCVGGDYKAGGNVTTTYTVKILSGGGTSERTCWRSRPCSWNSTPRRRRCWSRPWPAPASCAWRPAPSVFRPPPTRTSGGDIDATLEDEHGDRLRVMADGSTGLATTILDRGAVFSVAGIVGQRASRKNQPDGYRVWIRDLDDVLEADEPDPVEDETDGGGDEEPEVSSIATALRAGKGTVTLEGVITAGGGLLDSAGRQVVMADDTGAVELFLPADHPRLAVGWFFRLFEADEQGWKNVRTPDGRAIGRQDAFFWGCMESIARTLNLMIFEERRRLAMHRGG